MRKLIIFIAILLLLLLLLLLLFLFFPGAKAPVGEIPDLSTPAGERTIPQPVPAQTQYAPAAFDSPIPSAPFAFNYPVGNNIHNEPSVAENPQAPATPPSAPTTFPKPAPSPVASTTQSSQLSTTTPTDRVRFITQYGFDGVTTPRGADFWPPRGDGVIRIGGYQHAGSGGQPDFEFDPMTGDGRYGDYYFSLAQGTIVDFSTSPRAGDPDNMVLAQSIGIIIGSLVGLPDIGLTLGTGIGSNLFPGYRLSDFGLSVQNGIPSFGDFNPGGLLGSDAASSITGAAGLGGGTSYYGGFAVALPCTCSEGNFWWSITTPVQYMGTYIYTPSSKLYENYGFVGAFWALGSYEEDKSADEQCLMYEGEDCLPLSESGFSQLPIKGTLNSSPGTGTSAI